MLRTLDKLGHDILLNRNAVREADIPVLGAQIAVRVVEIRQRRVVSFSLLHEFPIVAECVARIYIVSAKLYFLARHLVLVTQRIGVRAVNFPLCIQSNSLVGHRIGFELPLIAERYLSRFGLASAEPSHQIVSGAGDFLFGKVLRIEYATAFAVGNFVVVRYGKRTASVRAAVQVEDYCGVLLFNSFGVATGKQKRTSYQRKYDGYCRF